MDQKKERILIVAEGMFSRFGIQKTTMNEIATKARMGKSTLYYYFKSKEDIFAEVIKKDSNLFKNELNKAISKGITPQDKLANYILARMQHLKSLSNYYTTLTDEYLEHFAFVENARKDFIDFEIATLSLILSEGLYNKIFTFENLETTARNFAICLKGFEAFFLTNDKDIDIEVESREMLTILFKGIEVR